MYTIANCSQFLTFFLLTSFSLALLLFMILQKHLCHLPLPTDTSTMSSHLCLFPFYLCWSPSMRKRWSISTSEQDLNSTVLKESSVTGQMSDNWRAKCLSLQSGINPEHSLRITKAVLDLEPFPVKIFLKSILQAETGKEKKINELWSETGFFTYGASLLNQMLVASQGFLKSGYWDITSRASGAESLNATTIPLSCWLALGPR